MTPEETRDVPERRATWFGLADEEGANPWSDGNLSTNVTAYLLAGPLGFGGLGWLASRGLHAAWPIPVGVLFGLGLSIYVIWLRYGRS